MTYKVDDDRRNPEPWKTNYVRESYAREKHPDNEEIIQMRRQDFDNWLERHDAAIKQGEPSDAQVEAAWRAWYGLAPKNDSVDAFEVGKALERLRSDLDRGNNYLGHIEVDASDLNLVLASAQGEPTEVHTCTYCSKKDATMVDEDGDAICSDCALPYTSGLEELLRSLGYNELALLASMTKSELSARQRGA